MTSPAMTAADLRIAQARRDLQRVLHGRVDEGTQRIFRDELFLDDPNVIPIRAGLIGQVVRAGQQVLVSHFNDQMTRRLGLDSAPKVPTSVFERPGVDKTTEYSRPFYTSLQLVRAGKSPAQAIEGGSKRLRTMTATDLQMAKVRQARIALRAAGRKTFRRVPTSDAPCELCELAADQIYYTEDLMPIHPGCSCDVEADEDSGADEDAGDDSDEDTGEDESESEEPEDKSDDDEDDDDKRDLDDIEVREHGEIGPLLTWASDHFTGPDDLPNPPDVVASPSGGEERGPGIPESVYDRARAHLNAINLRLAQRAS